MSRTRILTASIQSDLSYLVTKLTLGDANVCQKIHENESKYDFQINVEESDEEDDEIRKKRKNDSYDLPAKKIKTAKYEDGKETGTVFFLMN